jgi:peptide/nickel transport system ATP-binding protein
VTDPLLAIRGLTIAFPGASSVELVETQGRRGMREVVHGIDLDVERGRVVALVGESGSGKSVTAMSVLRLHGPEVAIGGQVLLDGTDLLGLDRTALRAVRGGRVGMVFQEPMAAWNPVHTVGRQIEEAAEAHAERRSRERGDSAGTTTRVEGLLASVGLDDPARIAASYPHQLSGGQLQRAMIAMATSCDPELLIADEPTTALDVTVQAGILDLLRRLAAERDMAILLITHDMGVVADLADDVAVMREGTIVERGEADAVLCSPQDPYTQGLLAAVPQLPQGGDAPLASSVEPVETTPVVARVTDGEVTYGRTRWRGGADAVHALRGVDVTLHRGRTLGVVGESGSGKSTLGRALTGLVTPDAGSVLLGGTDLGAVSRRRRRGLLRRVGIVFQDPGSSLDPKHRVGEAIAEPLHLDGWSRDKIRTRIAELLESVDLEPSYAVRYPHQLSGGQRQRVAIARALALNPQLLVADEPTSALDVSVQARVLELIRRLQHEHGFACLFISHDLAVVGAVSDEVAVMRDGVIVERGTTRHVMTAPEHPYTASLLAAAPVPDPRVQRERRLEVHGAAAAGS